MPYGSDDLAFMLADFGEVVVFDAYTARGILSFDSDLQDLGANLPVMGTTISLEYATASLPNLKKGSPLTVAGTAYKVKEPPRRKDDGAMSIAYLELT